MRNLYYRVRNRLTYLGVGMTIAGLGVNLVVEYGPAAGIIPLIWENILAYIGIGCIIIGLIIAVVGVIKKPIIEEGNDAGLTLLRLLDESYHRMKVITEKTIKRLRKTDWSGVNMTSSRLTDLTGKSDVTSEIQNIINKGVFEFLSGKPLTFADDAKKLGNEVKASPLFTMNPEIIAKQASIALRENIPYLDNAMKKDLILKRLFRDVEREGDKYPSETVSEKIDAFLDHARKINAAWIYTERDLEFLEQIEEMVGSKFPSQLMLTLRNIPDQMDLEMGKYRNDVAVTITNFLKEVKQ
jgi:hypothetical protein